MTNTEKYLQIRSEHQEILQKSRRLIAVIFNNMEEYVEENKIYDDESQFYKDNQHNANIINKLASSLLKIIEKEQEILSENHENLFPEEQKPEEEIDFEDIEDLERLLIKAKLEKGLLKPNEVDFSKFEWGAEIIEQEAIDEITAELENEKLMKEKFENEKLNPQPP